MINTKELANKLGKNKETIRRWCRKNKIPFIKTDKDYMFDYEEVLNTLKQCVEKKGK